MYTTRRNNYLIHYNHNHDALGRFTSGPGGISKSKYRSNYKKVRKQVRFLVKSKAKILEHIKELKLDSILDGKRMEIRLYTGIPMVHML